MPSLRTSLRQVRLLEFFNAPVSMISSLARWSKSGEEPGSLIVTTVDVLNPVQSTPEAIRVRVKRHRNGRRAKQLEECVHGYSTVAKSRPLQIESYLQQIDLCGALMRGAVARPGATDPTAQLDLGTCYFCARVQEAAPRDGAFND